MKAIEVRYMPATVQCELAMLGTIQRYRELLSNVVANARLIPDPAMQGSADCYSVPLDDITAAADFLEVPHP